MLFEDTSYANSFLDNVKCIVIEIHDEYNCRDKIYEILKGARFIFWDADDLTVGVNKNFLLNDNNLKEIRRNGN